MTKFVKDIENEPSSVLYLMKFSKKEERDKNLRLLRGVVVTGILAKDADNFETITLQVQLDGAQYKMDLMKLAVEDAMFVEESYAACQAVVKMPRSCINRLS